MRIAVADDVGQLKVITTTPGIDTTIKPTPTTVLPRIKSHLTPDAKHAILATCVIDSWLDETIDAVAVAQASGTILILDTTTGSILLTRSPQAGSGKYTTLSYSSELSIVTAGTTTGHTTFISTKTAVANIHLFPAPKQPLPDAELTVTRTHPTLVGPASGIPGAIAIAGREREVEIYTSSKSGETIEWKQTFASKNVKNDKHNLRVPVWTTDLQFLPDREDGNFALAVVTKAAGLRIYHPGLARRPILEIPAVVPSTPTGLLVTPYDAKFNKNVKQSSTPCLIISTNTGLTVVYDVAQKRAVGQYSSSGTGSILGLRIAELDGTKLLAAVGSDRYLYVWNLEGRKLVSRVWLKTRGTGIGFLSKSSGLIEEDMVAKVVEKEVINVDGEEREGDEEEGENVWDGMEKVDGNDGNEDEDEILKDASLNGDDEDDEDENEDGEDEYTEESEVEVEVKPAPVLMKKRKEAIQSVMSNKKRRS